MTEITLPHELLARCWQYGQTRIREYRENRNEQSRAMASRNADKNFEWQAEGKIGECGFALWKGLDPLAALNWSDQPDNEADIEWHQIRIDVKSAKLGRHLLIWPIKKTMDYPIKRFDILVLVKVDLGSGLCQIDDPCWISKLEFARNRQVATQDNTWRLDPGTRYMHELDLWPRGDLERNDLAAIAIRIGRVFEFVTGQSLRPALQGKYRA